MTSVYELGAEPEKEPPRIPSESDGKVQPRAPAARSLSVVVATSADELEAHVDEWEDLAVAAVEPNPFFEHWMLIPAIRMLGAGSDLRVVLVYGPNPSRPAGPKQLCGVFPLERSTRYKSFPLPTLSMWRHRYCFLSLPLIREGHAEACLRAFLEWLAAADHRCSLMEFKRVPGEGPFSEALVSLLHERRTLSFVTDAYARAVLRPAANADVYLRAAISREHRKDFRRRSRRLSERGLVEYSEMPSASAVDDWTSAFLELEASGWKGRTGGALASRSNDRDFFTAMMTEAANRNRLMMLSLDLDGKPVSLKCNLLAGDGAFAFKIAYDEEYSYFSPGVLLELENIRRFHARRDLTWMDSCASPEHPMIDRLWLDRRVIQNVLIPTGQGWGSLWVSLLPMVRWLSRKIRNTKPTESSGTNTEAGDESRKPESERT